MTDKIKFLRVFLRERDKNEKTRPEFAAGVCVEGGGQVTKQQKKDVRKALRRYGRERAEEKNTAAEWTRAWGAVIRRAMDYYEKADPDCAKLLQLRYIDGLSEWETVGQLYIGRTTYYRKELEVLSTVGMYAARAGLI